MNTSNVSQEQEKVVDLSFDCEELVVEAETYLGENIVGAISKCVILLVVFDPVELLLNELAQVEEGILELCLSHLELQISVLNSAHVQAHEERAIHIRQDLVLVNREIEMLVCKRNFQNSFVEVLCNLFW